jgi:hypothetical protein
VFSSKAPFLAFNWAISVAYSAYLIGIKAVLTPSIFYKEVNPIINMGNPIDKEVTKLNNSLKLRLPSAVAVLKFSKAATQELNPIVKEEID